MRFSDIIGRSAVKERLLHSVKEGRISHAQLFSGPEGCGGLPFAIAYAAYIHCERPTDTDSCGTCPSCIKYKKLVHPDLHFTYPFVTGTKDKPKSTDFINQWRSAFLENPYMDINDWYAALGVENKQGFISVEESVDILRKLSLKSFESPYKIQIIWMPEKMKADSSNKLLKILEEPPEKTVFLLVTEHREMLLPTIISRTQLVKIPKATTAEVSEEVELRFKFEKKKAWRIASLADGNISTAIHLSQDIDDDTHVEEDFINWMRLCYNPFHEKDGKFAWKQLNSWIEVIAKSGREYQKSFLSFCLTASRECLLVNQGDSELVKFDDEVVPNFSRFTRFIHSGNIDEITQLLNKAHYAIERNANPKILFLDLSFKLSRLLNKSQ